MLLSSTLACCFAWCCRSIYLHVLQLSTFGFVKQKSKGGWHSNCSLENCSDGLSTTLKHKPLEWETFAVISTPFSILPPPQTWLLVCLLSTLYRSAIKIFLMSKSAIEVLGICNLSSFKTLSRNVQKISTNTLTFRNPTLLNKQLCNFFLRGAASCRNYSIIMILSFLSTRFPAVISLS